MLHAEKVLVFPPELGETVMKYAKRIGVYRQSAVKYAVIFHNLGLTDKKPVAFCRCIKYENILDKQIYDDVQKGKKMEPIVIKYPPIDGETITTYNYRIAEKCKVGGRCDMATGLALKHHPVCIATIHCTQRFEVYSQQVDILASINYDMPNSIFDMLAKPARNI